jgi:hypothetical protein
MAPAATSSASSDSSLSKALDSFLSIRAAYCARSNFLSFQWLLLDQVPLPTSTPSSTTLPAVHATISGAVGCVLRYKSLYSPRMLTCGFVGSSCYEGRHSLPGVRLVTCTGCHQLVFCSSTISTACVGDQELSLQ